MTGGVMAGPGSDEAGSAVSSHAVGPAVGVGRIGRGRLAAGGHERQGQEEEI